MGDFRAYELKLFGACEFRNTAGEVVRFPTRHSLHILAILAMEPETTFSRGSLAATTWPEADSVSARNSFRTALAALRKGLPPESLDVTAESVTLRSGYVRLLPAGSPIEAADFMPGFETDWAIDVRMRCRQEAVAGLIKAAEAATGESEAERLLTQAGQVDPLSQEAAEAHIRFLNERGLASKAAERADTYRFRAVRDLGMVPDLRQLEPEASDSPLFQTAEWLLAREPRQALSLLASTQGFWLGGSLKPSLKLHERALKAAQEGARDWAMVNAQRFYILATGGQLANHRREAGEACERAVQEGETAVAVRLASALAYCNLSLGEFQTSLSYAERAHNLAQSLKNPDIACETAIQLAIIQQHVGSVTASRNTLKQWAGEIERNGSLRDRAQIAMFNGDEALDAGRLAQSFDMLQHARRLFETAGADRGINWTKLQEATLLAHSGDTFTARERLLELRALDPEHCGQSFIAMTEDTLAWVDSSLGEVDTAVAALARSYVCRRKHGAVPSVFESNSLRTTRATLRERIGDRRWRQVFQQAVSAPVG